MTDPLTLAHIYASEDNARGRISRALLETEPLREALKRTLRRLQAKCRAHDKMFDEDAEAIDEARAALSQSEPKP